jgi:hypothetical protein
MRRLTLRTCDYAGEIDGDSTSGLSLRVSSSDRPVECLSRTRRRYGSFRRQRALKRPALRDRFQSKAAELSVTRCLLARHARPGQENAVRAAAA